MTIESVADLALAIAGGLLIAYGIALVLNVRGVAARRMKAHAEPDQEPDPFPVGSRMGRDVPPKTVTMARLQGVVMIVVGLGFISINHS